MSESSDSCNPLIACSVTSSSSWQFVGEAPIRCFHLRLLHAKCGHVYFLECHESTCPIPHVGWVPEKIPPEPPSSCYEVKYYIRMKDERCEICQSYVKPPLTRILSTLGNLFGRKEVVETSANPIALPQEAIDAIVLGWHLQIKHTKDQKMQYEEERWDRMKVCDASAVSGDEGTASLETARETLNNASSDEEAKRPAQSEELLLTFE